MHRAPTLRRRDPLSPLPSLLRDLARRADETAVRVLAAGGAGTAGLAGWWDGVVLRHRMRQALGYRPDVKAPRTYNEKLAWRILHDANPLLALTTDKLKVREYVADRVGSDVLIPVLGVYERAEDLPWDELPEQFVLKATHGCEMTAVVRDKSAADRRAVLAEARSWLGRDYYELSHERIYRGLPRRLMVESLLTDEDGGQPADFKLLVFHGRVALVRVHSDRFADHRVNFFDSELRPLRLAQVFPERPGQHLPVQAASLVTVAEKLAHDLDYARVDLYLARGRIWFGEITHHDGNACVPWRPFEMDEALGDLWRVPIAGEPEGHSEPVSSDEAWDRFDRLVADLRRETADH